MAKEIFISYSRKDFDEVRKIKDLIDKELDIDCWMDIDGIESDAQFVDVIVSAINSHEVILFMMSANSMTSKWTRDELALAERNRKRIVLIDLDHSRMPDDFFLLYNSKEKIEWSNLLQRSKLYSDLRKWIYELLPLSTMIEIIEKRIDFYTENDRQRFLRSLREYAVQGYAWAQRQLGMLYWTYDLGTPEFSEAEGWLRKAALQGDAKAQYETGYHNWEHGWMNEAKKWFSMAAAQGHAAAKNRMKTL
jgi:hypothetical protein